MALPAVKTDAWCGCPEYKGKPGTALADSRLLSVRWDSIIIYALDQGLEVPDTNDVLYDFEESCL